MGESDDTTRILVVDDSKVVRESVRKFLQDHYELVVAADGNEAWQTLTGDEPFDLLVTDIAMPGMDGYSLICRIRDTAEAEALRRIPIIVITGLEDEVTRLRAFACGADHFIPKPLRGDSLRQNIANQLTHGVQENAAGDVLASMGKVADEETLRKEGVAKVAEARDSGSPLSLISVQLSPQDEVVQSFGKEMLQQLRLWLADIVIKRRWDTDIVAQLEHAAFVILSPGSGEQDAMVVAERVYSAFASDPYPNPRVAAMLTPKVGYATLGEEGATDFDGLLSLAETRRDSRAQMVDMGVDESVIEEPTVEQALTMLANGEDGKLLPYSMGLADRVLPLLELCNEQQDLGLDAHLTAIRNRIKGTAE